jgi:hypothetical protein
MDFVNTVINLRIPLKKECLDQLSDYERLRKTVHHIVVINHSTSHTPQGWVCLMAEIIGKYLQLPCIHC